MHAEAKQQQNDRLLKAIKERKINGVSQLREHVSLNKERQTHSVGADFLVKLPWRISKSSKLQECVVVTRVSVA